MLHDLQSVLRAARGHAINAEALKDMEAATPNLQSAAVKVWPCPEVRRSKCVILHVTVRVIVRGR